MGQLKLFHNPLSTAMALICHNCTLLRARIKMMSYEIMCGFYAFKWFHFSSILACFFCNSKLSAAHYFAIWHLSIWKLLHSFWHSCCWCIQKMGKKSIKLVLNVQCKCTMCYCPVGICSSIFEHWAVIIAITFKQLQWMSVRIAFETAKKGKEFFFLSLSFFSLMSQCHVSCCCCCFCDIPKYFKQMRAKTKKE